MLDSQEVLCISILEKKFIKRIFCTSATLSSTFSVLYLWTSASSLWQCRPTTVLCHSCLHSCGGNKVWAECWFKEMAWCIDYCTEKKTEWLHGCTMAVSASVVNPHNCVTDKELGLLPLPSIIRVLYHILLAWEKIKIQNLRYNFYRLYITFAS